MVVNGDSLINVDPEDFLKFHAAKAGLCQRDARERECARKRRVCDDRSGRPDHRIC